SQFEALLARVTSQEKELAKFQELVTENQQLREKVASLTARLAAVSKDVLSVSPPSNGPSTPPSSSPAVLNGTEASTWATVTKRHRPANLPVSERKRAAAARGFQVPSGPQGFDYLYIPRGRRMDRPEIRRRLRKLGLESTRILDISFPTRKVIGLLVHAQYAPIVLELLEKAKVNIVKDFDPTNPSHLADPKFEPLSAAERQSHAIQLNRQRCINALKFMRPSIAAAVCHDFLNCGWIDAEDAKAVLATAFPLRDRDNPASAFISTSLHADDVDDDMLDAYATQSRPTPSINQQ
ncbi:hypothetical protein EC973_007882, partial [Apophysomyces ossiformis]